jgi:hypothetical protein
LLGRHVGGGPHGYSSSSKVQEERRRIRDRSAVSGILFDSKVKAFVDLENLRQPKVQNLGFASTRNKDICWLDVAMDDPLLVRCV